MFLGGHHISLMFTSSGREETSNVHIYVCKGVVDYIKVVNVYSSLATDDALSEKCELDRHVA